MSDRHPELDDVLSSCAAFKRASAPWAPVPLLGNESDGGSICRGVTVEWQIRSKKVGLSGSTFTSAELSLRFLFSLREWQQVATGNTTAL